MQNLHEFVRLLLSEMAELWHDDDIAVGYNRRNGSWDINIKAAGASIFITKEMIDNSILSGSDLVHLIIKRLIKVG